MTALPPPSAQYLVLLARATAGMQLTEYDLEWTLPPERGWAYIHTADILAGARTRWPVPSHNPEWEESERIRTWAQSLPH